MTKIDNNYIWVSDKVQKEYKAKSASVRLTWWNCWFKLGFSQFIGIPAFSLSWNLELIAYYFNQLWELLWGPSKTMSSMRNLEEHSISTEEKLALVVSYDCRFIHRIKRNESYLFRFRCSSGYVLSKTKSVTPPPPSSPFFYMSDITNSSSFNGKIFRKKMNVRKLYRQIP